MRPTRLCALRAEGLKQDSAPLPDLALVLAARAGHWANVVLLQAARARLAEQQAAAAPPGAPPADVAAA